MSDAAKGSPSPDFRFSPRPNRAREIEWREWGPDAFQEAQEQDRPLLLAISAVWCHWCHVMDETTYSDPTIVQAVNQHFIPVRVDSDRHPDINQRYNMGGWPTTVFLTPGGDVITGGTYMPPDQMQSLLPRVGEYYREHRDEIDARLAWARQEEEAARRLKRRERLGSSEAVREAATQIVRSNFDPVYGGLGTEPKFPQSDAWELLLLQWQLTGDDDFRDMVVLTLDRMQRSDLFDRQEGGFFRYATTRDWREPHYEKMLEDNALLLQLYLRAWHLTGEESFRTTAQAIIAYLMSHLYQPETSAFSGSQDADEHYYSLPLEERRAVESPYVDPNVYVGWNGVAASALILASGLLQETEYLEIALKTLDYLWEALRHPVEGMLHCLGVRGLLSDQVNVAKALLDAFEATGDSKWLERAQSLVRLMDEMHRAGDGALTDRTEDSQALGRLRQPDKPILENSIAAEVYIRLHRLTGAPEQRERAVAILRAFAPDYGKYGVLAAAYAKALHMVTEEPTEVAVVGGPQEEATRALRQAALRLPDLHKLVLTLEPDQALARGYQPLPLPTAYVCVNRTCSEPVLRPEYLEPVARRLKRT